MAFVREIFVKSGVSDADAGIIADALVWANLRGVDSHGVVRIPRYLEMYRSGEAKPAPAMKVAYPRGATILIDADGAAGPVALTRAVDEAMTVARKTGVAWAAVRGTVHAAAVGYYAERVAAQGLVAIGLVAGVPNMAYHGSRAAGVATSPIAIAVPSSRHGTILLDMATATIALGKINQHKIQGLPLPEGVALTADGAPTTDPNVAAIPLPMGGAKGSGLSLMFELLTSVLVANPIMSEFHSGKPGAKRHRQNAAFIVADVAAFSSPEEFAAGVDRTIDAVKALPKADEAQDILFPGERGARVHRERSAGGIPVAGATWKNLTEIAGELGIALPEATVQ